MNGSFKESIDEFIKQFITNKGYLSVLDGLFATLKIAVFGLIIGG